MNLSNNDWNSKFDEINKIEFGILLNFAFKPIRVDVIKRW